MVATNMNAVLFLREKEEKQLAIANTSFISSWCEYECYFHSYEREWKQLVISNDNVIFIFCEDEYYFYLDEKKRKQLAMVGC